MDNQKQFALDEFNQGFQYALHVLSELGVDVESLLGSNVYKKEIGQCLTNQQEEKSYTL